MTLYFGVLPFIQGIFPLVCFDNRYLLTGIVKIARSHQRVPLYWSGESLESHYACCNRWFEAYFSVSGLVRGIQMEDAPYSISSIEEPKRVLPTLPSHFSWSRAQGMIFGGNLEQALTLPTVQTVFLWLVWMLRKKTAKVSPLNPEVSTFRSMV